MKKTNLLFKRILPCLLIIVTVFALVSCKGCKKTTEATYPTVTPSIDNPQGAYFTIGDYKVTNETVYTRLLKNYGLETLEDLIIKDIIAGTEYDPFYSTDDFKKNLDEIIHGDLKEGDEGYDEAEEAFRLDMRAAGFFTEAEYTAYYQYTYDKMNYVVKVFKDYIAKYNADEANEEDFFTEDAYKDYYKANNRPKVSIILITFDSQHQALKAMEKANINVNKLNGNWEIDGVSINENSSTEEINAYKEKLQNAFASIYEATTGSNEAVKTYESKELGKISSSILTNVYNLNTLESEKVEDIAKSYTHAPALYGSRYYLTIKVSEDYTGITKYEDANKDEILHFHIKNYYPTLN